ncbi:hypothetical protein VIGAN_04344600 [Vigna angularis var. angularis]|uniref:Uncharacterized protein n=1 Tax=Vigna angularis var. angularis TaxID=157739 RepID=A0A0S3RZ34_PHAAN|nr:hypothetical protein VIGAN_04344600 [Vigna angularis var. angularis]
MRNKSETRQPKFLLSRIRTDMRDLGLPVLQDPITSHLGTHSSNISSKVLDRYIDGEQHPEESRPRNNSQRNNSRHGSYGIKRPPKVQLTAPNSPTHGIKDKPRVH